MKLSDSLKDRGYSVAKGLKWFDHENKEWSSTPTCLTEWGWVYLMFYYPWATKVEVRARAVELEGKGQNYYENTPFEKKRLFNNGILQTISGLIIILPVYASHQAIERCADQGRRDDHTCARHAGQFNSLAVPGALLFLFGSYNIGYSIYL
jgi:hypothetical protein